MELMRSDLATWFPVFSTWVFLPQSRPGGLLVLQPLELGLLLGPLTPPLGDVLLQLLVQLVLLNSLLPLGEGFISLRGGVRHGFVVVRHDGSCLVLVLLQSQWENTGPASEIHMSSSCQ